MLPPPSLQGKALISEPFPSTLLFYGVVEAAKGEVERRKKLVKRKAMNQYE